MSPRFDFTEENKVATTNYDYPKLKLKSGERARILTGLEAPVGEYVHTLRKPQIINGVPQTELLERKDGSKYEDFKMDFVSRPICLGDMGILQDKGIDPKNCPMCQLAQDHPDWTTAPQLRYAMHVVRYRTKTGGFDLVTPFSAETLVWGFTGKTFNKIADFKTEWGDLRKHDLLLGPCTNESFQQFDITVASKAAWLEDAERKTLVARTFKENLIPDLSIACGSRKERKWVDEDVSAVTSAWAVANGAEAASPDTNLDEDLSNILDSGKDAEGWAKEAPEADHLADATDDLNMDDLLSEEKPAPAKKAPAKKAAPKEEPAVEAPEEPASEDEPEEEVENFDDLLNDLGD